MQGHVMPSFHHTRIGLGPFANLGCQIVFTKTAMSVIHPDRHTILEGWREVDGPRLWGFLLQATQSSLPVTALFDKYEEPGPRGSAANFYRRLPSSQFSAHQRPPCHPHTGLLPRLPLPCSIPAKDSAPWTMLAKPAMSATSMERHKPWLLLPGHPQPLPIPAALISPAWVRLLDSTMHASASLSNRHGWMPSRPATATSLTG